MKNEKPKTPNIEIESGARRNYFFHSHDFLCNFEFHTAHFWALGWRCGCHIFERVILKETMTLLLDADRFQCKWLFNILFWAYSHSLAPQTELKFSSIQRPTTATIPLTAKHKLAIPILMENLSEQHCLIVYADTDVVCWIFVVDDAKSKNYEHQENLKEQCIVRTLCTSCNGSNFQVVTNCCTDGWPDKFWNGWRQR
jgi:hypothetical protein